MKLTDINLRIIAQAKKHFKKNCNDEASRNLVLSSYFAEEYDLTNDEAKSLTGPGLPDDEASFYKWYYFNIMHKELLS